MSSALINMDCITFWFAIFSSSFVKCTSLGTMRWSSSVFRLFLRRLRRRSPPVSPVSSSSCSPSALMLSSSRWSLSVLSDDAESLSDEPSSPSSRMLSDLRRLCLRRPECWGGPEAPTREEERLRAWVAAVWSSMLLGVGGWTSDATLRRACREPSSLWRSLSEWVDEGGLESVASGNTSAGCSSRSGGAGDFEP